MIKTRDISLDDLLAEQRKVVITAAVQAIPGKPDLVKITPWISGRGCACRLSIVTLKDNIHRLLLTDHRHQCCGRLLNIVEVEFTEDGAPGTAEFFAQIARYVAATPKNKPTKAKPLRRKSFTSATALTIGAPTTNIPLFFRLPIELTVDGQGGGGGSGSGGDDGEDDGEDDGSEDSGSGDDSGGWNDNGFGDGEGFGASSGAVVSECEKNCLNAFGEYGSINAEQRQFCRDLCKPPPLPPKGSPRQPPGSV